MAKKKRTTWLRINQCKRFDCGGFDVIIYEYGNQISRDRIGRKRKYLAQYDYYNCRDEDRLIIYSRKCDTKEQALTMVQNKIKRLERLFSVKKIMNEMIIKDVLT